MRIINTLNNINSCYRNDKFNLDLWKIYVRAIFPSLEEICIENASIYSLTNDILPILDNVLVNKEALIEAKTSFIEITKELNKSINKLFSHDLELDIILYLGLCNKAGWATSLNGRNVILLVIEKIIELNWQNINVLK